MKNLKTTNEAGQNSKSSKEVSKTREEGLIQSKCVEWFRNNYCLKHHKPRYDIFSVPNEATYKNNQFKALGVRNGVSDLVVVLSNKVLFIELKDGNNQQSTHQIDFEKVVTDLNHSYFLIRSFEQFQQLIWQNINQPNAQ
jgi:hypothetical protein